MSRFTTLPGLPVHRDSPVLAFPREWAHEKSAGVVVEFAADDGRTWIGNFRRGSTAFSEIALHPNGREVVVIANGAMWIVDPRQQTAQPVWPGAEQSWRLRNPDRLVVGDGRTFLCLDVNGERWRTPTLTQRAGFEALQLEGERLRGLTWAVLTETWIPFKINLLTGTVYDGAGQLEMPFDFSRIAGPGPTSPLTPAGRRRLAAIRRLRRAAFASLLAMPLVVGVLAALNKLTGGATKVFASGAPWTEVFWSTLFCLMPVGVLLTMVTVTRSCPRCQQGFFVSKGYTRSTSAQWRGTVNVFAGECLNCHLPLKGL